MGDRGDATLLGANEKGVQRKMLPLPMDKRRTQKWKKETRQKCGRGCGQVQGNGCGRSVGAGERRCTEGEDSGDEKVFIRAVVIKLIQKALRSLKSKEALDIQIIESPHPLPPGVGERGEMRPSCSCPHRHEPKIPAGPLPAHPRTSARIGYLLPIVCTGKYREWL